MKNIYLFCLLLVCGLMSFLSAANLIPEDKNSTLVVEQAYIRATIPGTSISSSYMEIENQSDSTVSLLSVSSDISPRIEIHQHIMTDGMMRMRKLDSLAIESKARVKLQPSGLHLMIFDVATPLNPKEQVELTLHFSNNVSVTMEVPVYSPVQEKAAQKTMLKMHKHHH
ncbi:copper chaperone PCu(A)C [Colwellia sp. 4_MG-2023]|jgi:copper(I)-binding protein|uniref:copper chaperone PCu(A)C n=1 Tax=unclassified Colwellia TaxID=196834 RepID=UPI001C07F437|nr:MULTISPECIES: copper chaperone PCu(A)C [unclassified Colwellia]MBU2924060.1 copper chaperone PCu(A)C [Colwellia sp. C2M11]MDO6487896.1 copper chaperone PCu(A)C [Colwellia sp. 6_MG-2023]MDO6506093.1 copper chaperone PCu(A)C [Colwellia sp. 5_MG-2023]MDO6554847.1 copper chaperone PCu(A)C [Colwellia sp. 4_MG-2023]MDO6651950.1 copper chaperone PCu(A)C [Colwellia sp. 3_MG-2023]